MLKVKACVICDHCGTAIVCDYSVETARGIANANGWHCDADKDFGDLCPDCQAQRSRVLGMFREQENVSQRRD